MAFRSRFEHNMKSLKDEFEEKIRLMREFNREDFKRAEKRLDLLKGSIKQEISDRVTETDAEIGATQETLTRKYANSNLVRPAERIRRRGGHVYRGGKEHHADGRRH